MDVALKSTYHCLAPPMMSLPRPIDEDRVALHKLYKLPLCVGPSGRAGVESGLEDAYGGDRGYMIGRRDGGSVRRLRGDTARHPQTQ